MLYVKIGRQSPVVHELKTIPQTRRQRKKKPPTSIINNITIDRKSPHNLAKWYARQHFAGFIRPEIMLIDVLSDDYTAASSVSVS